MTIELPQISLPAAAALSCDNCGSCCMQVRSPPFVVYLKDKEKATFRPTDDSELAMEDYLYLATAPKHARRIYVDRLLAPLAEVPGDSPCVWLDLKTKQCRFYEHRPIICRDFEVGDPACLGHREREGIANVG